MGGLQTLEWGLLDADRVQSLAVIAASARHSAWCLSWGEIQRLALRTDPRFRDGHYDHDDAPHAGLGAARAIAMATYRSAASLDDRYGRQNGAAVFGDRAKTPEDFAVRAWVQHHAETFVRRFDANCYLTLIAAMDRHDVGHGRGGVIAALARIRQPVLVVSVTSDGLYMPFEQQAMYEALPNAELIEIDSVHGHDGFLIDATQMEPSIRAFRANHGVASDASFLPHNAVASEVAFHVA
jgi:homoserine O-acetyltransferase